MDETLDLTGKLLVAMPSMTDPRFEHSVILVCEHGPEGAMGLIVNKPTDDVRLGDVLDQIKVKPSATVAQTPVHFGGPVGTGRGFVLHSRDYVSRIKSIDVPGAFRMTATLDILEAIALGKGPADMLMMLGYAGWAAGQLEAEIAQNGWLTAEATPRLVFHTDPAQKWVAALASLGVDPIGLSGTAGNA